MTWSTIITIAVVIVIFIVLYKVFKWVLRLLVLVAFLLIAFVTNPSTEAHQQAVERKAEKENINLKRVTVEVDDYFVFSLTHTVKDDERKLVGAGAFTQVYIFREP